MMDCRWQAFSLCRVFFSPWLALVSAYSDRNVMDLVSWILQKLQDIISCHLLIEILHLIADMKALVNTLTLDNGFGNALPTVLQVA